MHSVFELLVGLHLLLLLAFIGVTSMLLVVTVVNRARLRDVMLSWPNGRFFGMPVWSSLFLAFVLGFILVTVLQNQIVFPLVFVGYMMGGTFWFAAAVIMCSVHVTPHGVVLNVNRDGRALAWTQIIDYFELGDPGQPGRFVFFYRDGSGSRQRLELEVPTPYRNRFRSLVRGHLDSRFNVIEEELDPHTLRG